MCRGAIGRVEERIGAMRQRIADALPGIENVEAVASAVSGRLEDASKLATGHAKTLDGALARSSLRWPTRRARVEALAGAIAGASESIGRPHRERRTENGRGTGPRARDGRCCRPEGA